MVSDLQGQGSLIGPSSPFEPIVGRFLIVDSDKDIENHTADLILF